MKRQGPALQGAATPHTPGGTCVHSKFRWSRGSLFSVFQCCVRTSTHEACYLSCDIVILRGSSTKVKVVYQKTDVAEGCVDKQDTALKKRMVCWR